MPFTGPLKFARGYRNGFFASAVAVERVIVGSGKEKVAALVVTQPQTL